MVRARGKVTRRQATYFSRHRVATHKTTMGRYYDMRQFMKDHRRSFGLTLAQYQAVMQNVMTLLWQRSKGADISRGLVTVTNSRTF